MLFVKANRFLSKDSVKKEKNKIKSEIKAGFITGAQSKEGRVYMRDGQLVESSGEDDSSDEGKPAKKQSVIKVTPGKNNRNKKGNDDDSSGYEDLSDESELEEEKKPALKRK